MQFQLIHLYNIFITQPFGHIAKIHDIEPEIKKIEKSGGRDECFKSW